MNEIKTIHTIDLNTSGAGAYKERERQRKIDRREHIAKNETKSRRKKNNKNKNKRDFEVGRSRCTLCYDWNVGFQYWEWGVCSLTRSLLAGALSYTPHTHNTTQPSITTQTAVSSHRLIRAVSVSVCAYTRERESREEEREKNVIFNSKQFYSCKYRRWARISFQFAVCLFFCLMWLRFFFSSVVCGVWCFVYVFNFFFLI